MFVNDFELMNAKEAAAYLHVSLASIYNLANQKFNAIPHVRIGARIVFTKQGLNEYILRNTING